MFYIGNWNTQKIISHYIENNEVKKVLVIYTKGLYQKYDISIDHKYIEMHEVKDHKIHYALLQYVNRYTLIVLDNLLISQQRYIDEYNCIANFTNQTPHRLVFNYLPFIEDKDDFMILLDFYNRVKYKGERFDYNLFADFKYFIKPVDIKLNFIDVSISAADKMEYEHRRDKLFSEIGLRDPRIIPNDLSELCGDFKYKGVDYPQLTSRNRRYKNLTTYKDGVVNTILDLPVKRKDFVELITKTKETNINILTSNLSMDRWYKQDYLKWVERLKEFYDKADFFKHQCCGSNP